MCNSYISGRIYTLVIYFFIYSFLGWSMEVIYMSISNGHFLNRGFLIGPFCCIYGFGSLLTIIFLKRFRHNIFILFSGAAAITSTLEFITGFLMEKFFNSTWWDYSDQPFNIAGRVCLRNSIIWGAATIIMLYIIHPFVRFAALGILRSAKPIVIHLLITYLLTDFIVSSLIAINVSTYTKQLYRFLQEFFRSQISI